MASLSLLAECAILIFLSAVATGTTSKLVNSSNRDAFTSFAAITPVSIRSGDTLDGSASSFPSTTFTRITVYPSASPANVTVNPGLKFNMATAVPQEYTCEQAERVVKETYHHRCISVIGLLRARCYLGTPKNCCQKGKGPASCPCYAWWPKEAPRELPIGDRSRGNSCILY